MSYVLIIGARSDIAKALARKYAGQGYNLYLAARNANELDDFANDISLRTHQTVKTIELNILDYDSHASFYQQITDKPLGVISAVGYLGDQIKSQVDFTEARLIMDTNYTGIVSLLNIIAEDFEQRRSGFIVAISSVAGDRGRKSNYTYGSAKAALSAYLSGLRNRLFASQVHVMTVKPGFVATKMTENMDLPEKLTAQPEDIAEQIYIAQQQNKNVLYSKWIWRWIMFVIKAIPEWQFKKMSI